MRGRFWGMMTAAIVIALAPSAEAQLDLNPLSGYYKNIPRAAKANDVGKVRQLLSDGASPNQTDEDNATTGMHITAASGNLQIMAILYKAGADINIRNNVGDSPLDLAAQHDQLEAVKLLLEMKARVNDQDKNGMTALMFAAKIGDVEMVRYLLDGGANASTSDFTGRDAIGWAQDSRRPLVVEMLKKAQTKH
ncbi:MAG TPA: ankyrin repeat domain-containing protein [Stellaceae bacterium]|jgi:ankyrin repeat protein|nr:ankyrin repeat domain-containing protein [Stellaceae bacterium]